MKKEYIKPAMQVAMINIKSQMLTSSDVTSVQSNCEMHLGGGSTSSARSKDRGDDWDEEDEAYLFGNQNQGWGW